MEHTFLICVFDIRWLRNIHVHNVMYVTYMYKDEIVKKKFTTPENYNHQLHKKRATEKAEVESAAHLRSQEISGMIS